MPIVQYSGDPTKFADSVGLVDDSTPRTATNLNLAPQGLADRTAFLKRWGLPWALAQNWCPAFTVSGQAGQTCAAWDGMNLQWMVGCQSGPIANQQVNVSYGADQGAVWQRIGNQLAIGNAWPTAVVKEPGNFTKYWLLVHVTGGETIIYQLDTGGANTWVQKRDVVANGQLSNEAVWFNGQLRYAVGAATAGASGISWTTDGGTSWVDITNQVNQGAVDHWLFVANGPGINGTDVLMAVPAVKGTATANYLTTTNGTAWTLRTFPSSVVGASDVPVALAWDSFRGRWVLAVNKTVDQAVSLCSFYYSADGISWTALSTLPTQPPTGTFNAADLAALGGAYVAATADASNRTSRLFMSADGGATWQYTQGNFSDNLTSGTSAYSRARLYAGTVGLFAFNAKLVRTSLFAGLNPNL